MQKKPKTSKKKKVTNNTTGIVNFYSLDKVQKFQTKGINPNYKKHHIKVAFRAILVGSSGAGKTNVFLNILVQMANTFNHLYIYTRAQEPLYDYLVSQLGSDLLTIKYDLDSCRTFDEKNYYGQSLIVFDDMCNEKDQKCIEELYIRGRKIAGGCSLLYLTQSYYKVPKVVRLQTDYIFIIKVSGAKDLNMILSEYSLTATKQQLQKMYTYACINSEFGSFFLIDLQASQDKTYRKNFNEFLYSKD
jgi:hypothetical protein